MMLCQQKLQYNLSPPSYVQVRITKRPLLLQEGVDMRKMTLKLLFLSLQFPHCPIAGSSPTVFCDILQPLVRESVLIYVMIIIHCQKQGPLPLQSMKNMSSTVSSQSKMYWTANQGALNYQKSSWLEEPAFIQSNQSVTCY